MLTKWIDTDVYILKRLDAGECAKLRWRFVKIETGAEHFVVLPFKGRPECDCQSFVFDRGPKGQVCKHIAALVEEWLLPKAKVS